ncbi:MAG: sensor histidine kinase [Brevinematia bacterium]
MKIKFFFLYSVLFFLFEFFCFFYLSQKSEKYLEKNVEVFYYSLKERLKGIAFENIKSTTNLQLPSFYIIEESQMGEISKSLNLPLSAIKSIYKKEPPFYLDKKNLKGYLFYFDDKKILFITKDLSGYKKNFYRDFIFLSIFGIIFFISTLFIIIFEIKKSENRMKIIENLLNQEQFEIDIYKDTTMLKLVELISKRLANEKELLLQNEIIKRMLKLIDEKIAIIEDEKIYFVNDSFKKEFSEKSESKNYWEVFKDENLINFIEREKEKSTKIKLDGKIYSITKERIKNYTLLYLKDISNIENLENKKRELISYISHELRTPITIIKGYVETAIEEIKNERPVSYLLTVLKHANRLENLLKDLLTIVQLDSKNIELDKESFRLKDLIEEVIRIFHDKLSEKEILIEKDFLPAEFEITASKTAFYVIFSNLLDNAIKHTSKGKIQISTFLDENNYIINFLDTGEGIREEDLPYIFDEFYVGNKGRAKDKSGTGLGLSIVKKLILLHNGSIKVESKPYRGTKFTIVIPVNK